MLKTQGKNCKHREIPFNLSMAILWCDANYKCILSTFQWFSCGPSQSQPNSADKNVPLWLLLWNWTLIKMCLYVCVHGKMTALTALLCRSHNIVKLVAHLYKNGCHLNNIGHMGCFWKFLQDKKWTVHRQGRQTTDNFWLHRLFGINDKSVKNREMFILWHSGIQADRQYQHFEKPLMLWNCKTESDQKIFSSNVPCRVNFFICWITFHFKEFQSVVVGKN